jgi:hypothetical protein
MLATVHLLVESITRSIGIDYMAEGKTQKPDRCLAVPFRGELSTGSERVVGARRYLRISSFDAGAWGRRS